MEYLTSRKNKLITHLRRLGADREYRRTCGEFLCDGVKLLQEAVQWNAKITTVLWSEEKEFSLPGAAQYRAPQDLLDYVSPLKHAEQVLFSVTIRTWPAVAPGRTLILETIQDPGNLGTILRTANALGMDNVILTGDCADVYNPKTVRATMGAVFRQPFYEMELEEMHSFLQNHSMRLYGAALSDKAKDIRSVDLFNTAVAIGSEGRGLSPAMRALCDGQLIIPMREQCESLNAAIAAAIVMWELRR